MHATQRWIWRNLWERGALWMSLPVVRKVSNSAWCRIFSGISCFTPLNFGTLLLCPWAGHFTLKCFTWKVVPGRAEMAMRRICCRIVCSLWKNSVSKTAQCWPSAGSMLANRLLLGVEETLNTKPSLWLSSTASLVTVANQRLIPRHHG